MKKLKKLSLNFVLIIFFISLYAQNSYSSSSEEIWKCGTIAPPGSGYEKVIKKITSEIEKILNVKIKVYYANSFKDEIDIAEGMKSGKLDCGMLTGNGLGYLSIYTRVLELPFLIKSKNEWNKIRNSITTIIANTMRNEGWELIGLFGVGFVHFLSKYPIERIQDFSDRTFWVWDTNPIQVESFSVLKTFGTKPLEVSPLDLLSFSDKIDIIWGPIYAFVAYGWYRNFKYIMFPPVLYFPGGAVVSSEKIKGYSQEQLSKIRDIFLKEEITEELEILNEKAYEILIKSGIKRVEIKDVDKLEGAFKSQMYESFKKYLPSWLMISVMEEVIKVRDIR